MGGIFFAMVFAGWVPAALLIVGLALAIVATVLYAQTGIREVRAPAPRLTSSFVRAIRELNGEVSGCKGAVRSEKPSTFG